MKNFFKILFIIFILCSLISCQTVASYKLSDEKLISTIIDSDKIIDSGNIIFTKKGNSIFSKMYWTFKKQDSSINKKTIQIEGCRTFSSDKNTIRTSSTDATINTLMGIKQHDYEWSGKLIYDSLEIPVWYHFWVAGSSRGMKEYELSLDYCGGKEASFKDKLKFFEYYVPEDASILTMQSDINKFHKKIPLLVAKFTTNSNSEYYIYATRSKKYEAENFANLTEEEITEWMPKTTSKEIILDEGQIFQIVNMEKNELYAECSKNNYTIYSATNKDKENDVKNCIGAFIGYLWAIDEHEKAGRVLTSND